MCNPLASAQLKWSLILAPIKVIWFVFVFLFVLQVLKNGVKTSMKNGIKTSVLSCKNSKHLVRVRENKKKKAAKQRVSGYLHLLMSFMLKLPLPFHMTHKTTICSVMRRWALWRDITDPFVFVTISHWIILYELLCGPFGWKAIYKCFM